MATKFTAETITDEQIRELIDSLPDGHYAMQWCHDAFGSHHHPVRKRNARRECAEILNARTEAKRP